MHVALHRPHAFSLRMYSVFTLYAHIIASYQGWMILEFIVTMYHGKKYHGITIYHDIFLLSNGVHYCSGYIYSYTLHEVYIQTFNN